MAHRKITEDEVVPGAEFIDRQTGERVHVFSVTTSDQMATVQHKGDDEQVQYSDASDLENPDDPNSGKVKTRTVPATVKRVESVSVEALLPRLERIPK